MTSLHLQVMGNKLKENISSLPAAAAGVPSTSTNVPNVPRGPTDKSQVPFHEWPTTYTAEEWTNTGTQAVRLFYPTYAEMKDFNAYIKNIEAQGAHKDSGICKVCVFILSYKVSNI